MSDDTKVGNKENFYIHVLRNYIPTFGKIALKRYVLTIGIFNKKGFEQKNKESKNTLR